MDICSLLFLHNDPASLLQFGSSKSKTNIHVTHSILQLPIFPHLLTTGRVMLLTTVISTVGGENSGKLERKMPICPHIQLPWFQYKAQEPHSRVDNHMIHTHVIRIFFKESQLINCNHLHEREKKKKKRKAKSYPFDWPFARFSKNFISKISFTPKE